MCSRSRAPCDLRRPMTAENGRGGWEDRHRSAGTPGAAEPFLLEMLPLLPRGRALDVAAGRGRNSLAMARAGFGVAAVDYAESGLRIAQAAARAERLPVWPVVADATRFPIRAASYDVIVNINFLERGLFEALKAGLKVGGMLLVDTFLVDQAAIGHPRDPRYLLEHFELNAMLAGLDVLRYREGLTVYADGANAWRASALAERRG
jgi:tellurite methyltransferase